MDELNLEGGEKKPDDNVVNDISNDISDDIEIKTLFIENNFLAFIGQVMVIMSITLAVIIYAIRVEILTIQLIIICYLFLFAILIMEAYTNYNLINRLQLINKSKTLKDKDQLRAFAIVLLIILEFITIATIMMIVFFSMHIYYQKHNISHKITTESQSREKENMTKNNDLSSNLIFENSTTENVSTQSKELSEKY
jgi:hypothetical protein